MESIREAFYEPQGSNSYSEGCLTGKNLARQFISEQRRKVNHPQADGSERHALGDLLFSEKITAVQTGFCYELLRQIEPLLLNL